MTQAEALVNDQMMQHLEDWQTQHPTRPHVSAESLKTRHGNWVTYLGKVEAVSGSKVKTSDGTGNVTVKFEFDDMIEGIEEGDFIEIQGRATSPEDIEASQMTKVHGATHGLRAKAVALLDQYRDLVYGTQD